MIKDATDAIAGQVNFAANDWDGYNEADQVFHLYAGLSEAVSNNPNTIWPHIY